MIPKMSAKKWSNEDIVVEIWLKNSVNYVEKFTRVKGKSRQIGAVWDELAREVKEKLIGVAARIQYNYIFNQFKKHKLIAVRNGESGIKWKYFGV